MNKQFVTYEIALKLKELGFNELCLAQYFIKSCNLITEKDFSVVYDNMLNAPLWQQVIDWFRVKYNVLIIVYSNASGYLFEFSDAEGGTHRYDSGYSGTNDSGCWDTFEEARTASILMAIARECNDFNFN